MENATKALIMVGAILLAMLILAVGLYLHGRLGQTADSYTTKLDTVELKNILTDLVESKINQEER